MNHRRVARKGQYDLAIYTLRAGYPSVSPAAVEHIISTDSVTIHDGENGSRAIDVSGRDQLRCLRDALVAICKDRDIA